MVTVPSYVKAIVTEGYNHEQTYFKQTGILGC